MMKKPAIDDTCLESLQAAAASLTKSGASTSDIVTAFVDVAIGLAESDRAYAPIQLDIVANLFSAGRCPGAHADQGPHTAQETPQEKMKEPASSSRQLGKPE